jgi:CubicO group peptidase (beta-lactamase class C family)
MSLHGPKLSGVISCRHVILLLAVVYFGSVSLVEAASVIPNAEHLKATEDYNFATGGQSLLVIQNGKILAEKYDNGGAASRRQMLASGSKSFVGIAAVAAVQDGIIKLDDYVCEAIPEWRRDQLKSRITYRQLLSLTSGLTPSERGRAVRAPAWEEIAAKPMVSAPGERFDYGAYHLNCFAYALEKKLKNETFENYLKRRVLDPLGVVLEWRFRCDDGHPQVGGGGFMTARDWAKFGQLIADGGRFGNEKLIDPDILAECFKGSRQNPDYGLTWWLARPVPENIRQSIPILRRGWGALGSANWLPTDLVAACGAGNQRLYVIPSLNMIIVRNAPLSSARMGRAAGRTQIHLEEEPGSELGGGTFSDFELLSKLFAK